MTAELNRLTITEARDLLRKREISAQELTRACLDQIKLVDPKLNAFITVCARRGARTGASRRRSPGGRRGAGAVRHPARDQGYLCDARSAHDLRLEDPRDLRAAIRRHGDRDACGPTARSLSAKRTWTSSRWAPRPRTPPSDRPAIRIMWSASRADRRADRRPRSLPTNAWDRSAPTPADRFASRLRSAAWSASSRLTAASAATA